MPDTPTGHYHCPVCGSTVTYEERTDRSLRLLALVERGWIVGRHSASGKFMCWPKWDARGTFFDTLESAITAAEAEEAKRA